MPKLGWTDLDVFLVSERAHALHSQGCYLLAAALFEGLVALDPQNAYCRDALAASYLALNRPADAATQASAALRIDPESASARARRCQAYVELGRTDLAHADVEALRDQGEPAALRLAATLRIATSGGSAR